MAPVLGSEGTSPVPGSAHAPTTRRRTVSRRLRRVAGGLRAVVTATAAGGVLLAGSPVLPSGSAGPSPVEGRDGGARAGTVDGSLALVASVRHRWRGHPGRTLVPYRVRRGDTATGLAVRFHAWTRELRAVNHLGRHGHLEAGQRIMVPVVDAAARRHRTRHHAPHRTRHHAPHRTRHHAPHRTRHHRSRKPWGGTSASRAQVRRVVVRTARHHGVDPQLALAIAWQESGWQQRRTSSAGAVGVMQVLPGTGRWMSQHVGRRLNIYALRDNVTAGVVLFKVLRSQTSWRRSIASYYQGLGAVQRHGLYPSTKRYTRSVTALHRRLHRGWNPA